MSCRSFVTSLALCGSLLWASAAGAVETLYVDSAFSQAVGPAGMVASYCGGLGQPACTDRDPVQVRWGTPAEFEDSGMGFSGQDNVTIVDGVPFLIGSLSHYNFPIFSGTGASGVTLNIQVLVEHNGAEVIFDETVTIDLAIDETPNVDPCIYPSALPCADRISLVGGSAANVFTHTIGNVAYNLTILGFLEAANGTGRVVEHFISDEGQATTAYMVASLSREILLVADAGPDQVLAEGTPVQLDGSASLGVGLEYHWTPLSSGVTLSDPSVAQPSFVGPLVAQDTVFSFELTVTDGEYADSDTVDITLLDINNPPVCSGAAASPALLWPPNHRFRSIAITGVNDPDGDPVQVNVVGVLQDERVNERGDGNTGPDAIIDATGVRVRAERSGRGNGRVYAILYVANDGFEQCSGVVQVGVPHDPTRPPVAGAFNFDSTQSQ